MSTSVFDLFKIGIGPSSSHTVGPMRAARQFSLGLQDSGLMRQTRVIKSELFGSLSATGRGHRSDKAVLLRLEGETPEKVDVTAVDNRLAQIREPEQVENAAEIGMEHNLGLTCDPISGLVQIPCIERNAMGAVKAINAARIALRGDGKHFVSLDKVIKTRR